MGAVESAVDPVSSCTQIQSLSKEEIRPPWALAQADRFDCDECPFCKLRQSNAAWLRTELKRLTSEVCVIESTIPPKFLPELNSRLENWALPESYYTGGVDDISAGSCSQCDALRQEVKALQEQARSLDAQRLARVEFRRGVAWKIEDLLIQKRQIEARLFQNCGPGEKSDDGQFSAITRVNLADEDAILAAASPI
eukprot:TRINITY_DN15226_c0_g1_i1.p1 TRINITY_DN15226_c0_g1~~TRINITY_DN15226_c0_g1_i1.p1  ORF type:complete len:196 (-),score=39.42 TRINITY_DN15226_c0_g1_i1:443-1030(-)